MSIVEAEYEQDGDLIEYVDNASALEAINRSEIDVQIATAKKWPRSIKAFRSQALEMATLDEDTAATMFYALPRGGKKIEGPSVRLAEVVGSSWGNLRYGARIVATDDKFVTAQGMCFDLEKNIAAAVEVKRRITDKKGNRFNDDMIQVTSNAACSIALRQAIFKVVPFAFVKSIYEEAKLCSIGKASSMAEKRHKAFDWFKKAGATEAQILSFLGRKGVDDVTIDDLVSLRGLVTAIKDGETTLDDALRPSEPEAGSKAKKSDAKPSAPKQEEVDTKEIDIIAQAHVAFDACKTIAEADAVYDRLKGPEATVELTPEQSDKIEHQWLLTHQRINGAAKRQSKLGGVE